MIKTYQKEDEPAVLVPVSGGGDFTFSTRGGCRHYCFGGQCMTYAKKGDEETVTLCAGASIFPNACPKMSMIRALVRN